MNHAIDVFPCRKHPKILITTLTRQMDHLIKQKGTFTIAQTATVYIAI